MMGRFINLNLTVILTVMGLASLSVLAALLLLYIIVRDGDK